MSRPDAVRLCRLFFVIILSMRLKESARSRLWTTRISWFGSGGCAAASPAPGREPCATAATPRASRCAAAEQLFIFDGGSGLRLLGNELMKGGHPRDFDLFYTHTHLDHCHGLPFFAPCYDARNRIRVWAGHLKPDAGIAGGARQDDVGAAVSDPDRHLQRQARIQRFLGRRVAGAASRHHAAYRAAQPSEPRHRLPARIRRQGGRLHHRHRARARHGSTATSCGWSIAPT